MNIDRVQGLIDLYLKAGKSRPAVETMADYFLRQGEISEADFDAVMAALDAQDASQVRIDLRAILAERDEVQAVLAGRATQVSDLEGGVS